ncbi:unnamed protein product [Ectocarpus fasciculatus]
MSTAAAARQQRKRPAPPSASEEAIRLMKHMRPAELRKISKAAMALEKRKLEDSKKVAAFVAKNDNFVDLVGDCYICLEPLLNNIGTTKFGVVSWRCRCTVPQKAHSACVFSKICHVPNSQGTCDMCDSPMMFEKTRRKGTQATIRFHRDEERTDDADPSSDSEVEGESSGSESLSDLSNDDSNNGSLSDDSSRSNSSRSNSSRSNSSRSSSESSSGSDSD